MMTVVDKYGFFDDLNGWFNYVPLILFMLEETSGSNLPVLDVGYHEKRSHLLRDYAAQNARRVVTIEEDILVAARASRKLGCAHHEVRCATYDDTLGGADLWSVAVLDHSPGERRRHDASRLASRCDVIVLHDTEPDADYGYRFSEIWPLFKSRVDIKTSGAWASAVSCSRDLSRWRGTRIGPLVVSAPDDDLPRGESVAQKIERSLAGDRE